MAERKKEKLNRVKHSANTTYDFATNLVIKYNLLFLKKEKLVHYPDYIVSYQVKKQMYFSGDLELS